MELKGLVAPGRVFRTAANISLKRNPMIYFCPLHNSYCRCSSSLLSVNIPQMHFFKKWESYCVYYIIACFFSFTMKQNFFTSLRIDRPYFFSWLYRIPVCCLNCGLYSPLWPIFGLFLAHASHAVNILVHVPLWTWVAISEGTDSENWIWYFHFAFWKAITLESPRKRAVWPMFLVFFHSTVPSRLPL